MKRSFMKATILCLIAGLVLNGCKKGEPVEEVEKSVSVTGVSLNETSKTLPKGETFVLTATVVPDDATNKTLVWASSNAEIASVVAGTVSAIAAGEAVITVSTEDGGKIASCTVTVVETSEIPMTTTADELGIGLAGYGTLTVDWGDGNIQEFTLDSEEWSSHNHTYAAPSGNHTITITGAKVTGLECSENQLTALDVSKNTALTAFYCGGNQLTALDVSKNTALTAFYCGGNQLTALDVSKNTALMLFSCYSNQLTVLNVSQNTALTHLDCPGNQLVFMDISHNTALISLDCYENQLNTLDVSKNTTIEWLSCYGNQLTALDVRKNTAIEGLSCYGNQLTALDVSKNTALAYLRCGINQLTALDVSKNIALTYLACQNNQLTALDVSKNTALMELRCQNNQLTVEALNALFGTLHGNTIQGQSKYIRFYGNPGENGCDKTIVSQKGWEFIIQDNPGGGPGGNTDTPDTDGGDLAFLMRERTINCGVANSNLA